MIEKKEFCNRSGRRGNMLSRSAVTGALALLVAVGAFTFIGCEKPKDREALERPVVIEIIAPSTLEAPELKELTCRIVEKISSREVASEIQGSTIKATLSPGSYTLTLSARYAAKGHKSAVEASYEGEVVIPEGKGEVNFPVHLRYNPGNDSKGLLFTEVFFTGSFAYDDDKYFTITNTSLTTPRALDGLVLVCTGFQTNIKKECEPAPAFDDYLYIELAYQFPGSGDEHVLAPGASITVCQSAIDHREKSSTAVDLRGAAFEWLDEKSALAHDAPQSPTVSNLLPLFYLDGDQPTKDDFYWTMNNNGGRAIALVKPGWDDPQSYFNDNIFIYKEKFDMGGGQVAILNGFPYVKIPNAWVIDCVSTGYKTEMEWAVTGALVDAGYASVVERHNDDLRYGKSVQRKRQNGEWVDTNNSSEDFEAKPAALLGK